MPLVTPPKVHVDGDDMTYDPIAGVTGGLRLSSAGMINGKAYDIRTGTQRLDELAAAVLILTQKVNTLERRLESMQGD